MKKFKPIGRLSQFFLFGFLKQSFSDHSTRDRLLSDPSLDRPSSTALPRRHYENSNPEEPMIAFKNASHTNFTIAENREKLRGAIDYVRGDFGKDYPLVIGSEAVATESKRDRQRVAGIEQRMVEYGARHVAVPTYVVASQS